jgi:hypothetical protein
MRIFGGRNYLMKKYCLLPVICSFFLLVGKTGYAQAGLIKKPGVTLGGNLVYSMPRGQFADRYKFGFGGEVYAGVGWGSTYLIGTLGITKYEKQSSVSNAISTVPFTIGLRKYLLLKRLFINGDLGSTSIKFGNSSTNAFTAGFGGGLRLLGLEVALYYNAMKNTYLESPKGYSNSVNVKIGWNFTL